MRQCTRDQESPSHSQVSSESSRSSSSSRPARNSRVSSSSTSTLFNRGKTNPGLFPDLETLHGDRDGDLAALEGRSWDAVIDTSGYVPRLVTRSAGKLRDRVRQYVFISTISVYAETREPGMDET